MARGACHEAHELTRRLELRALGTKSLCLEAREHARTQS